MSGLKPSPSDVPNTAADKDSDGRLTTAGNVDIDVTLLHYADNLTLSFGFAPPCHEIRGTLFIDANENGARDANELAVRGAAVELLQGSTFVVSTTATNTGEFVFGGTVSLLPNTNYAVRVRLAQDALLGLAPSDALLDLAT